MGLWFYALNICMVFQMIEIYYCTHSLEQLFLNKNDLNRIWYPDYGTTHKSDNGYESLDKNPMPFNTLQCLLLGNIITACATNLPLLLSLLFKVLIASLIIRR